LAHVTELEPDPSVDYAAIFDRSEQCAIIHDAHTGEVITANRAAARLHGYTRAEMRKLPLSALMSRSQEYGSAAAIEKMLSALDKGHETAKWRIRHRNGQELPIEATAFPLPAIDGRQLVVVQIRDIGPELIAQRREEQLRRLLADSFGGTLIVDAGLTVLYAAPSITGILGYAEQDLVGASILKALHPDDTRRIRRFIRALPADDGHSRRVEYRIRHADGAYRHHEASWRNLSANEDVGGILVNFRDVSARVEAEHDARVRREEIQHLSRYRTMAELGSAIAHELNQPVAAIRNYVAGCIALLGTTGSVAKCLEGLHRTEAEAARAARIMHSIREFTAQGSARRSMIRVRDIWSEIEPFVKLQIDEANAELTIAQDKQNLSVWGDKTLIGQVVLNLVSNALQAMQGNPADDRKLTITISSASAEYVQFAVSDVGIGMDQGQIDALFQSRTTSKAQHFGIGLLLSRSIITSHGGDLRVDSRVGLGTSMTFTLRRKSQRRLAF
jgi:two-component system, LuxR family, sensor kinase FixL